MAILLFVKANGEMLSALAVGVAGAYRYFSQRKLELAWRMRELAWQRTEFLFEQARLLDTDPVLRDMILILEDRHPNITIDGLYKDYDPTKTSANADSLQNFDSLLNFMDRLAYAYYDTQTLLLCEMSQFGWYLTRITENTHLKHYCEHYGFERLVKLSEDLQQPDKRQNWVQQKDGWDEGPAQNPTSNR